MNGASVICLIKQAYLTGASRIRTKAVVNDHAIMKGTSIRKEVKHGNATIP